MSLADEFLGDLDYDGEGDSLATTQPEPSFSAHFPSSSASKKRKGDDLDREGASNDVDNGDLENDEDDNDADNDDVDVEETEADRALAAMMRDVQDAKNARDIARLMDSMEMQGILKVSTTKLLVMMLWQQLFQ
jgi:U4/U6 small nuclear ribonucleoprotein PRP31